MFKKVTLCALILAVMLAGCSGSASTSSSSSSDANSSSSSLVSLPSISEIENIPEVKEILNRNFFDFDPKAVELIQFGNHDSLPKVTLHTSKGDITVALFPEQAPKAVENFIKHSEDGYYNGVSFHRVIKDFMIQGGDPEGTGAGGKSIWDKEFENEPSEKLYHFNGALSMANAGADTNGSQFFIVQNSSVEPTILDKLTDVIYSNNVGLNIDRVGATMRNLYTNNVITAEQAEALTLHLANKIDKIEPTQEFKDSLKPVLDKYKEIGGTPHLDGRHTVFGQVIKGMDVVNSIANVEVGNADKPVEDVIIKSVTVKK